MQLSSIFLAFLFSSAVFADGSGEKDKGKSDKSHKSHKSDKSDKKHHKTITVKMECEEIISLEKIARLAANTTELADKTHNNATKIAEITAKVSHGASRLEALKGNSTLVKDCAIIAAGEKLEHECKEIKKLEKSVAFVNNSTAVADKTKNNATKIAEIKADASKDATKLQNLEKNSTLVKLCLIVDAAEDLKHNCKEIKKLEKSVAFAANTTAVADKTKNNATKVAEIQAKASKDATHLAKLKSNATLVSDCASLEKSTAKSLGDTEAAVAANSTSSSTSEASEILLVRFGVLSSIVITAAGIMML